MYYKIENKDSELYKKLSEQRKKEIEIEESNKIKIMEFAGSKFENALCYPPQKYHRCTLYTGFLFLEPEKLNQNKMWVNEKREDLKEYVIPNQRSKNGAILRKFLYELPNFRYFDLLDFFEYTIPEGVPFSYPFIDFSKENEILCLYLDKNFKIEHNDLIEITSKEFYLLTGRK